MKISQQGIDLIKKYEGLYLKAYKCPAGVWTIGYGHTKDVHEGMEITRQQAEEFLRLDLEKYEEYVERYAPGNLTQGQFDALTSFTYNCGLGSLKTLVANRSPEQIAEALLLYVKAGGMVLNGLIKRRNEERALFMGQDNKTENKTATDSHRAVLKQGSKGKEVELLQGFLYHIGYEPGTPDGDFGSKTKKAVQAFQEDAGLSADGIVGKNTWEALDSIRILSRKQDGNTYLTQNFKAKEFASKDGYDKIVLHIPMVRQLQKIRDHFGKPVTINSGYRSRSHNKKVGGAANSYHVKGRAFDIVVAGISPHDMARYAQSIGINGIIRYSWGIHVDSRPKRYWAMNNGSSAVSVKGF